MEKTINEEILEELEKVNKKIDRISDEMERGFEENNHSFKDVCEMVVFVGNKVWDDHEARLKKCEYLD